MRVFTSMSGGEAHGSRPILMSGHGRPSAMTQLLSQCDIWVTFIIQYAGNTRGENLRARTPAWR